MRAIVLTVTLMMLVAGCGVKAMPQGFFGAGDALNANARPVLGDRAWAQFRIAAELPATKEERAAVKLTYLMTDDTKHQSPQSLGMLRMLDDLPQKDVHNVVFRDGRDQGDAKLYYLVQGDGNAQSIANPGVPLAPGVTEVASNNPQVFAQVLAYTLDRYPGRRKYLQIYTHGGGVFGIGTDSNQTDPTGKALPNEEQRSIMRIPEFAEALRQGLKGRALDAVYFRACLMGNVEALYELRGLVRYAIASEDVSYSVDNSNLNMTRLFDDLANQKTEPAELVRQMAIAGRGKHGMTTDKDPSGYATIAAIEIERLTELKAALNQLANAMLRAEPDEAALIREAYDAVPNFGNDETTQRDLWAFSAALQQRIKNPDLLRSIDAVRRTQRAVMLHAKDAYGPAANGLSILMPPRNLAEEKRAVMLKFIRTRYQTTRFAQDGTWGKFIETMLSPQAGQTPKRP